MARGSAMINRKLPLAEAELRAFCCRNQIRKLSLFGSVLREDFSEGSDIDVLVEFEPGARVSLLDVVRMERELSELLGRPVDLLTAEDLSPYIRENVLASAEVQYAN